MSIDPRYAPRLAELTIKVRMVHVPLETLLTTADKGPMGPDQDELDEAIMQVCRQATNGEEENACGFVDATITTTEKSEEFVQIAFGLVASIMTGATLSVRAVQAMVDVARRIEKIGVKDVYSRAASSRLLEEYISDERQHNRDHMHDAKFVYVERE